MNPFRCEFCETQQPPSHRFCEECGSPLAALVVAVTSAIERAAGSRLAGVSDRGREAARNEDAFAVESDPAGDVLVVCDGVSTSPHADRASAAAAQAASAVARAAIQSGADGCASVVDGLRAAEIAVRALAETDRVPLSTIVLAVRRGRRLSVGWLGDSRAYFVGHGPSRRLTDDHTPFTEAIAAGRTRAEAALEPDAFALTRSLGGSADSTPDEPDVVTCDIPAGGGCVVLCTDGFWRACPEPEALRFLLGSFATELDALVVARRLVRHGCERHGHDNVTAAVLIVPPVAGAK